MAVDDVAVSVKSNTTGNTMPTPTEISIRQARKAEGILVPLLEDLLRYPVEIEAEDVEFLQSLIESRSKPRKKGIYSPSALGSCVRQVYFVKTKQKRKIAPNKKTYGIFLDGTFRHFKWQFALWKLHRAGVIHLIGCEIFVQSKRGDWGGTLDALFLYQGEPYIVDFKGMNTRNFMSFISYGTQLGYRVQITGYGVLVSASREFSMKIENCLLVAESKNGPLDKGSPLGLSEQLIKVSDYKGDVRRRLELLREYEEANEIPPPECTSTKSMEFMGCPFSWFCRGEVEKVEARKKRIEKRKGNGKISVRRSTRKQR
jgi:hypothetical protein